MVFSPYSLFCPTLACTNFMTPHPINGRNNFLVEHWGPKQPRNPSELIFAPFGSLLGHFSKILKIAVFQILSFLEVLSQLPLVLESWNFYGRLLDDTKCSVSLRLVLVGLIWYVAKILKWLSWLCISIIFWFFLAKG